MNKFERFVDEKTVEEKKQMVVDYEQFRTDGFIGKCKLRSTAREWNESIGDGNITSAMKDIAMQCYKYFATKYFEMEEN